jgi:hypothetical protein
LSCEGWEKEGWEHSLPPAEQNQPSTKAQRPRERHPRAADKLPTITPPGVLLIVLGIQILALGLIGEIIVFASGRRIKDYKVERIL